MKVVVVEPLGVAQEKLDRLAEEILGQDVEVVYYDHRETDPRKLIARGEDAEAIIVANQPLSGEVIRGFRKLQFLSVAFTGYDHIDMEACGKRVSLFPTARAILRWLSRIWSSGWSSACTAE